MTDGRAGAGPEHGPGPGDAGGGVGWTDAGTGRTDEAGTQPPELRPIDEKAVTLWRLTTLGRGAVATAAILAGELAIGLPLPAGILTAIAAVLSVAAAAIMPPLRYRAWGFALRESDVYLQHGVLFRTTSIVPHARIQHVDTRHGPLDRWLGLATLVVFTAGNRGAIISIPALDGDEAEEIRDRLAAQSGVGDAV